MGRIKRSIVNVVISLLSNTITLVAAFVVQRVFIDMLGNEYNGLNGLFTSIISMLSITELGIGTAIIYNLYKPVAEDDLITVKALLVFYKKSYVMIAGALFCLGTIMMLFLNGIVGRNPVEENIHFIFALFLIDCLLSYFLSYKRSILYVYQKNYILDIIHLLTCAFQSTLQIIILLKFENYIVYLLIRIGGKLVENIIISIYVDHNYKNILHARTVSLPRKIRDDIWTKVKALLFHRVGGFFVIGSDSIVITYMLGIVPMGFYTNYNLLLAAASTILKRIFEVLTYTIGNFLVTSNKEQNYSIYKKIDLLNFWVFGWAAVVLFAMFPTIVTIWLGTDYVLPELVVFTVVINFYLQGMRASIDTFKNAAGIFYEDRYVPLLEASVNIVFSVICAKAWGLAGVFMGTIISTGVLFLYSYPKYVCGPLFSIKKIQYVKQTLVHVFIVIIAIIISDFTISYFVFERRTILGGIFIFCVSTVIYQCLFILTSYKENEFQYFFVLLKNIGKREW